MRAYRTALRQARAPGLKSNTTRRVPQQCSHYSNYSRGSVPPSSPPPSPPPSGKAAKVAGLLGVFAVSAAAVYYYPTLFPATEAPKSADVGPQKARIEFEKAELPTSKDDVGSQHNQVRESWEHPGVYAWGSNTGKVIDPTSKEAYVKLPRRIPYFDGQLLRDIKLTQGFGAAVTEKGDVVQWGLGCCKDDPSPVETLKGKDITKITVSDDRIVALSSNGSVYAIPAERVDQNPGAKLEPQAQKSSWVPFLGSAMNVLGPSVRDLTPGGLGRGEKVIDISSGLQHCLLLTSKGRVFSAASSTSHFPSQGQMGIPGLTWTTRPKGPFDQPHEIFNLKDHNIVKIATGDLHSVVLDGDGRIFTFGDNTFGQLGFHPETRAHSIDVPAPVAVSRLYTNTGLVPKVTSIAAGGLTTFFTVDASQPASQTTNKELAPSRRMPGVTADTWACGNGLYGSLGTGRWTHVSSAPAKIKALSSLFEFDEASNQMAPIRLAGMTVGTTHAAATLDNATRAETASGKTASDTNWGADVLFWGGNEHYQLGTGKRANVNTPTYIAAPGTAGSDVFHRFQLTPRQSVRVGEQGKGKKVSLEQKVECGRYVSCVYSAA
ncbi:RCC1/BLIP-II [Sodiomyces alkalinus F11]|uniref:RCC1/BLIP-II n=1 Tax=Sodiomyces alkalinus (strain CBS 110278 / VKM F-3762 / F11) TaxID=1314773 RepID=A0A3N2PN23_SODAK|nr:RCC1/BLIP-II [Sodiomyces alkalinus F11]ROT35824.1 RCC1/BLIP-II [Sodiomyces alkalinus F11]